MQSTDVWVGTDKWSEQELKTAFKFSFRKIGVPYIDLKTHQEHEKIFRESLIFCNRESGKHREEFEFKIKSEDALNAHWKQFALMGCRAPEEKKRRDLAYEIKIRNLKEFGLGIHKKCLAIDDDGAMSRYDCNRLSDLIQQLRKPAEVTKPNKLKIVDREKKF
jgi:hypothetical protein